MNKTTSLDGTTPAIDSTAARTGPHHRGGRSVLRSTIQKGMAVLLADRFTVHEYDRRGRGDSRPLGEIAVQREIGDLAAVVSRIGEETLLLRRLLAITAAAAVVGFRKVAVYEPPATAAP